MLQLHCIVLVFLPEDGWVLVVLILLVIDRVLTLALRHLGFG